MGTHIGIVPTGAVTHALLLIFNGANAIRRGWSRLCGSQENRLGTKSALLGRRRLILAIRSRYRSNCKTARYRHRNRRLCCIGELENVML